MPDPEARYFDAWYADMQASPTRDALFGAALGLPPELESTSLLPWDGIADVAAALRLPQGGHLVDLACGRGGYGLELAERTGARVTLVDYSRVAVARAAEKAVERGLAERARAVVGSLLATGLADGVADAVVVVDAVQFVSERVAALREVRRVLRSGGRAVLTCWEPVAASDDQLPERLRGIDLAAELQAAGYDEVHVVERPDWRAQERALWERMAALDGRDDPAVASMVEEGTRSLADWDRVRRVLATATAP